MQKILLIIGAAMAFMAVAAGAFGAHALKQKLDIDLLNAFEVGVRYQMHHALALIAIAILYTNYNHFSMAASAWLIIAGTCLFSGSLYILALTGIRMWGALTPVGGILLLIGWLMFALGVIKS